MLSIQQNLTTSNYTSGSGTSRIKYIVEHYTGNNGDTAFANTNYFKSTYRGASAHYFVDETSIWQCVADKNVAWHCGATSYKHAYCRNSNSIGIEMCSKKYSSGNYYIPDATQKNASELTKYLMGLYNVSIDNVIRHYDVTGKSCPEPFVRVSSQWDAFKLLVTNSSASANTDKTFEGDLRSMTTAEKEKIVKDLYAQALGRIPSVSEVNTYVTAINNGKSFKDLYYSFHDSTEGRTVFVKEMYRFILGRDGNSGGISNWVTALKGGKTYSDVIQGFLDSEEYKNKNK